MQNFVDSVSHDESVLLFFCKKWKKVSEEVVKVIEYEGQNLDVLMVKNNFF